MSRTTTAQDFSLQNSASQFKQAGDLRMLSAINQMPGSHRASTAQAQLETEAAHTPVFWNPADKLQDRGFTNSNGRKLESNSNVKVHQFLNHQHHALIDAHSPTVEEVSKFHEDTS